MTKKSETSEEFERTKLLYPGVITPDNDCPDVYLVFSNDLCTASAGSPASGH
jgi:hypothetical protein